MLLNKVVQACDCVWSQWIVFHPFSPKIWHLFRDSIIHSRWLFDFGCAYLFVLIRIKEVVSNRHHLTTVHALALIDDWNKENLLISTSDVNDTTYGSERDCSENEDHHSESQQSQSSDSSDEGEDDDSPSTFLGKKNTFRLESKVSMYWTNLQPQIFGTREIFEK